MKHLSLLVLAVLAACGGTNETPEPDAHGGDTSPWLGNWMSQGTQSTTCAGGTGTSQLSGLVVISAGAREGTIRTSSGNCGLIWDLDGATAFLEEGQVCTVS